MGNQRLIKIDSPSISRYQHRHASKYQKAHTYTQVSLCSKSKAECQNKMRKGKEGNIHFKEVAEVVVTAIALAIYWTLTKPLWSAFHSLSHLVFFREIPSVSQFYRWRNWDLQKFNSCSWEVTREATKPDSRASGPPCCNVHLLQKMNLRDAAWHGPLVPCPSKTGKGRVTQGHQGWS